MASLPSSIAFRLSQIPKGVRDHVERSRKVGRELATLHETDIASVDEGIAAHDLARAFNPDTLIQEAYKYGINPSPIEHLDPVLLHGPVTACWLKHDAQYTNDSVIKAVRWHTTGHPKMDKIGKVIFLADKLDPDKIVRFSYLKKVQSLAVVNLDEAIIEYLNKVIAYLLTRKALIHPDSLNFRNHLLVQYQS